RDAPRASAARHRDAPRRRAREGRRRRRGGRRGRDHRRVERHPGVPRAAREEVRALPRARRRGVHERGRRARDARCRGGRSRGAVVAAVASFLAYDWFFVEPVHTFQVGDPDEWFALVLFLVTAVITGELAAQLRERAREAAERERETIHLYEERDRLREAATEAEVLRRADDLKTALLGAVSHDLRTPLASIIASAGSLRQRDVQWSDSERDSFLADIENEARRLGRIVANLLDLSRMESGTLRPERGWYDVAALVDDVVGRLRALTGGHAVRVSIPDDLPPVPLDYVEIDQVLTNVIENAARHTPRGSTIWIAAQRDDDAVTISVSDDGPGIAPNARARIFDPFV